MGLFQKLFEEAKTDKIIRYRKELLEILNDLDDFDDVYVDDDGDIAVSKGSARALIEFIADDDNDVYLRVRIPLVALPKTNLLAFYRHLLDKNFGWYCPGRLCLDDDCVLLDAVLDTDFITSDTIKYTVISMLHAGDDLDDELSEEFDTPRFADI
jgi:hypothetical protein